MALRDTSDKILLKPREGFVKVPRAYGPRRDFHKTLPRLSGTFNTNIPQNDAFTYIIVYSGCTGKYYIITKKKGKYFPVQNEQTRLIRHLLYSFRCCRLPNL